MKANYKERFTMARAAMNGMPEQLLVPDTNTMKRGKTMPNRTISHATHATNEMTETRDFKLQELTMLSITPILRVIHRWWLRRAEHHYLICADVEEQRAREAQMNVAYYQKRAALARSAQL